MRSFFLGALSAALLLGSVAATPVGSKLLTFKPANPRYTIAYNGSDPEVFIRQWAKKGYVVTAMSAATMSTIVVVMVKY